MAKGNKAESEDNEGSAWCRLMVNRTGLLFGLFLSIHILMLVTSGVMVVVGYDILPTVFDDLPLFINSETFYRREMAWQNKYVDLNEEEEGEEFRRKKRALHENNKDNTMYTLQLDLQQDLREQFKQWNSAMMGPVDHLTQDDEWLMKDNAPLFNYLHVMEKDDDFEVLYEEENYTYNFNLHQSLHHKRIRRDVEEEEIHEREWNLATLVITYESEKGNVLTQENLKKIAQFEFFIFNMDQYVTQYCQLFKFRGVYHCRPPFSILRLFDGTYERQNEDMYDPSFTDIPAVINSGFSQLNTEDTVRYFLSQDAMLDPANNTAVSKRTRSVFSFGYPLASYGNNTDNRAIQQQGLVNWLRYEFQPVLKDVQENGLGDMRILYLNLPLYWSEVFFTVLHDWVYLVGGILFIFLFMWFQTGSLFVTFFGIFSIMSSFVAANLIYRVIIGYRYFGIFNVLAIFIILGIGADDIFIFSDTWNLSKTHGYKSISLQLTAVYKRASIAMCVTSLTTMVAFFANSFSPILSIGAFGTYAGLCILTNYLSVITFFPVVVILYHKYFEHKMCLCCGKNNKDSLHAENGNTGGPEKIVSDKKKGCCSNINIRISHFLGGPYFRFVTHKVVACIILVLFFIIVGGSIYLCSKIEVENSQFRMFSPHDQYEQAKDSLSYSFMSNSNEPVVEVRVVWGLHMQDMSGCDKLVHSKEDECKGTTAWDENFDMNMPESQTGLLEFCNMLTNLSKEDQERLEIAYDSETGDSVVSCFIQDMAEFYQTESSQPMYPAGTNLSLPITHDKAVLIMQNNPNVYHPGSWNSISHPFEIALEFWLTHRFTNESIPDKRGQFRSFLGLQKYSPVNLRVQDSDEPDIFEKRLRYAAIEITTSMLRLRLGLVDTLPKVTSWENFISHKISQLPKPLQGGFQYARTWTWMKLIDRISIQSIITCLVGLALAFVVICLGTGNVLTGLAATFMLACVTVCVLAIIPLAGWKFGMLESLNLCLIVGLAVDYIVHLAEGYHMTPRQTRKERVQDSLTHVGLSVISGAITTLGAAFFLLFARLQFFKQFGTFLFATIGFSMVFSMFGFMAAFSLFGPQGYTGSFLKLCKNRNRYNSQNDERKGQTNEAFEM